MAMLKIKEAKKIIDGYYSALYLKKAKKIVQTTLKGNTVSILRFTHFNKHPIYVCGISLVIQLLKQVIGNKKNISVYGVKDGDYVKAGQPILVIQGNYANIAIFEGVIDGIIARCSSICNSCKQILSLIKPQQLIFMGDRADIYTAQPFDGYAAYVAGVRYFVTDAQLELIADHKDCHVVGTIPHALIQQHNGDLTNTLNHYQLCYKNDKLSALVDYDNDVCKTIKEIANKFPNLATIRIDTSSGAIDKSLPKSKAFCGVHEKLVRNARKTLNECNLTKTKIIVSSGFDYKKIKSFVDNKVPADIYGVGASLLKVNVNITGDMVYLENKPQAKFGRSLGIKINKIKTLLHKYI